MYKPLTPDFREAINRGIDSNIREFDYCERNAIVNMQIEAYKMLRNIINRLPDGYPIPLKK